MREPQEPREEGEVIAAMHERGWHDGFRGSEPLEADEVYLEGWESGVRAYERWVRRRREG